VRFMVITKATAESEAGVMPGTEDFETMGKFTETKELIAGFFLVEMKSLDECVEWFKRYPMTAADGEPANLEIRKLLGPDDFGDEFTAEQREAVQKREENAAPGYRSA
jgi:hypothetical protein